MQSPVSFAPITSMNSVTVATLASSTVTVNAATDSWVRSSKNASVVDAPSADGA